jgi:hypothetical protein
MHLTQPFSMLGPLREEKKIYDRKEGEMPVISCHHKNVPTVSNSR